MIKLYAMKSVFTIYNNNNVNVDVDWWYATKTPKVQNQIDII